MENTVKLISLLKDTLFTEKSKNRYDLPIPASIPIKNILYDWPSHEGSFKGATDFAVDLGTSVLAPLDGQVIEIVDRFDQYGHSQKFAPYLNYITTAHVNNEYSQLAHIAKGSIALRSAKLLKPVIN